MPYPEPPAIAAPHKVTLENRNMLTVTGVVDVESFDENMIVLHTSLGVMVIRGCDLHLQLLSLDGGQAAVSGNVDSLLYEEDTKKGGFFARLMG